MPRNVVYGLKEDLGELTIAEKYNLLGRPRKAKIEKDCPETGEVLLIGELVASVNFPPELIRSNAYLCDFGILIEAGSLVRNKLLLRPIYCAPELFHDMEPSYANDVWSYMVLFLHVYTGAPPSQYGPGFAGVLNNIVGRIGTLPQQWMGRYGASDKVNAKESWYGHPATLQPESTLSSYLDEHRPDMSASEKASVLSVIWQVFRPKAEDRITALGLLQNQDFNALMSIYGVQ